MQKGMTQFLITGVGALINSSKTMQKGMTQFLITGDAARNKVQTMLGGGYSTVKIELRSNWDELMSERGYRPLDEYKIINNNKFSRQRQTKVKDR